jgi:hypothetical protein
VKNLKEEIERNSSTRTSHRRHRGDGFAAAVGATRSEGSGVRVPWGHSAGKPPSDPTSMPRLQLLDGLRYWGNGRATPSALGLAAAASNGAYGLLGLDATGSDDGRPAVVLLPEDGLEGCGRVGDRHHHLRFELLHHRLVAKDLHDLVVDLGD